MTADDLTTGRTEVLTAGPAEGLAGLLGVELPDLAAEGIPALWHWIYLLDRPPQADLGPDGHPVRGVVPVPPAPGLRRMWASGRVRTLGPLVVEKEATRTSTVSRTAEKVGRSGPITFVTVRHEVCQEGRLVVEEDQNIVYRQPPTASEAAPDAPARDDVPLAPGESAIDVTPTLLARYSALTYNGHRIHYDRDYARQVEGYPGLLVHGPLQALVMAEAARRLRVDGHFVGSYSYRLVSPLFDHQGLVVSAAATDEAIVTAARDARGRQTATGTPNRR